MKDRLPPDSLTSLDDLIPRRSGGAKQDLAELIKLTLQRNTSSLPTVDTVDAEDAVLFIETEEGGTFFLEIKEA